MEKSDFYFILEEDYFFTALSAMECKISGNILIQIRNNTAFECFQKVGNKWEFGYIVGWVYYHRHFIENNIKHKIVCTFVDIWELKRGNKWLTNQSE